MREACSSLTCPLLQGQRLERVTVYPSDFGLERMAEEARLGPTALFGGSTKPGEAADTGAGGPRPPTAAAGDAELPSSGACRT